MIAFRLLGKQRHCVLKANATSNKCILDSYKTCRFFASNNNGNNESDLDLHKSYIGFPPRFQSFITLAQERGVSMYTDLIQDKITSNMLHSIFLALDLENPLLKKYDFDGKSFLEGAKV